MSITDRYVCNDMNSPHQQTYRWLSVMCTSSRTQSPYHSLSATLPDKASCLNGSYFKIYLIMKRNFSITPKRIQIIGAKGLNANIILFE